jgi:hypothetical protein
MRFWDDPDTRDFKERGLENVKLQILHGNFAGEKDKKARRWVTREEQKFPRRMFFVAFAGLIGTILWNVLQEIKQYCRRK